MMKKWLSLVLCMALAAAACLPARAASAADVFGTQVATEYFSDDLLRPIVEEASAPASETLVVEAKSAILMEVSTGQVLYESNADERLAPASITKIMSLLLIMEAIGKGLFTLDTEISASEHACSMGGSQIWLEPGETMTVDELLRAAVIASANDATVVLGEALAGSEEGFVAMMNKRAAELGMTNTTFINCTGLDAQEHLTTARDVALASCELIKHDLIKNYSTVWMDALRNGESSLVNTNKLVRFYEGCTGLKTGTTSTAGSCLSATAQRDGMELCAVVMGADNSDKRFAGARKLLDYGFANYAHLLVDVQKESLGSVEVTGGVKNSVLPVAQEVKSILIGKGQKEDIQLNIELPQTLEAPVAKGQQIGTAHIMLGDKELGTIAILAADEVKKMTFIEGVKRLFLALMTL